MKFKSGDMVIVIGGVFKEFHGKILTLTTPCTVYYDSWDTEPPQYVRPFRRLAVSFHEETLRLIKDGDLHVTDDLELPETS